MPLSDDAQAVISGAADAVMLVAIYLAAFESEIPRWAIIMLGGISIAARVVKERLGAKEVPKP